MPRGLAGYRLLRALASGAQGEVFLAVDTRLKRRVCIKLYHFDGGLLERRRVEREAWRLAHVASANVLGIHDVVARDGRVGIVTAYVAGCDLADLLDARGRLAPEEAVSIASDIAAGLAALRRAGIVHGDLSARNLLVDGDGRAIIADFGVAVTEGDRPRGVADAARTPEHDRGDALVHRSDFFALGLLLYRMLTGAHPFYRDGALDRRALRRGLATAPVLDTVPRGVRDELASLISHLLAPKPDQRPSGTFELRERLRVVRSGLPAPGALGGAALEIAARRPPVDLPLRLPVALVRLPWWRNLYASLGRYWVDGSAGARLLLVALLASPIAAAGLLLMQPGPCIEVTPPLLRSGSRDLAALPDAGDLHVVLTGALRRSAGRAMILGRGAQSDAVLELRPGGVRNACVADRSLAFSAACADGRCRIEVLGLHRDRRRRSQLELPVDASRREFLAAVDQLVAEQAAFILGR